MTTTNYTQQKQLWACEACSFLNKSEMTGCAICSTIRRPSSEEDVEMTTARSSLIPSKNIQTEASFCVPTYIDFGWLQGILPDKDKTKISAWLQILKDNEFETIEDLKLIAEKDWEKINLPLDVSNKIKKAMRPSEHQSNDPVALPKYQTGNTTLMQCQSSTCDFCQQTFQPKSSSTYLPKCTECKSSVTSCSSCASRSVTALCQTCSYRQKQYTTTTSFTLQQQRDNALRKDKHEKEVQEQRRKKALEDSIESERGDRMGRMQSVYDPTSRISFGLVASEKSQYNLGAPSACTYMALRAAQVLLNQAGGTSRPFGVSQSTLVSILFAAEDYKESRHLDINEVLGMQSEFSIQDGGLHHVRYNLFVLSFCV